MVPLIGRNQAFFFANIGQRIEMLAFQSTHQAWGFARYSHWFPRSQVRMIFHRAMLMVIGNRAKKVLASL
jgi:hypothetical protein